VNEGLFRRVGVVIWEWRVMISEGGRVGQVPGEDTGGGAGC